MKHLKLALLSSSLLLTGAVMAQDDNTRGAGVDSQQCMYNVKQSAPNERYVINESGASIYDTVTRLTWARCDFGQTWDNNLKICSGEKNKVNWLEAHTGAEAYVASGLSKWRVPNIKELDTISEYRCSHPAVNAKIFASTEALDYYFSSTPYIFNTSNENVMVYSARLGEVLNYSKETKMLVKYVHD